MKKEILLVWICCYSIFHSQAQDNWTLPGPATHPQFSFNECLATLGGDKVLEFGNQGETWVYDLSDNTWINMNPLVSPTSRVGHVIANIGGDKILLFGGSDDFNSFIPNNETWIYDLSNNIWTLQTPSGSPASRLGTALAFAGGDHAVLYGGDVGAAETWVFDLSDNTWTLMTPSANPGGQSSHAMASLDENRVLLFSGSTWVYDLSDNTWTPVSPAVEPSYRSLSAMASLGGDRILLFGGLVSGTGPSNDTWIYDYNDNIWTQLSPIVFPSERYGHGMASITTDHVLLYGGVFGETTEYLFTASPEVCPVEICNGIDDDCDDQIDEGVQITFYADTDHDGFGDAHVSIMHCDEPYSYVGTGTDCNDLDPLIYPDAPEIADAKDNDCDGLIDEGISVLNVEAGDCEVVYLGYSPEECVTINVSVINGTAPYTFIWSHGAATQNATVCPEETTIYTVTVTDQNGFTAQDVVTVQVIDIRCGNNNNKVLVCHIPPGNPENSQMICIAPSAVQAHLDHGCYIGICDAANPCDEGEQSIAIIEDIETETEENQIDMHTHESTIDREDTFSIFPNPADEYIEIQLPLSEEKFEIALYDLSGKLIRSGFFESGAQKLLLIDLTNGIYFLTIQSAAERMTTSIVVMH